VLKSEQLKAEKKMFFKQKNVLLSILIEREQISSPPSSCK
jgi:hypothetical protein